MLAPFIIVQQIAIFNLDMLFYSLKEGE